MSRKTEGVCVLVRDVLQKLPEPYGEDVIEDVFVEIEGDPEWHGRYDELVDEPDDPGGQQLRGVAYEGSFGV